MQGRGIFRLLVHILQKHIIQFFGEAGILHVTLNFGERAPSSSSTIAHHMPTVKSPLYFRYLLNLLWFAYFVYKVKKKLCGCHISAPLPCLCKSIEQTGCHFTTSATFLALLFASLFGCNIKWGCRSGVVLIASELL